MLIDGQDGLFEPFEDNFAVRNATLEKEGANPLKFTKTGTTIAGLVFKDGVIVGADSRATAGNVIADKYCVKLHKITDEIYACGAGTAADLDQVTKMLSSHMKLLALYTGRKVQVVNSVKVAKQHLFKYMGHIGAYLVVGGIDFFGAHLFNVHAGGSSQAHQFVADGSGGLAATSILEREFRLDMEEKDAVDLLSKALMAGMQNDLNSGNSFSYAVITKDGTRIVKQIVPDFCQSQAKICKYNFPLVGDNSSDSGAVAMSK